MLNRDDLLICCGIIKAWMKLLEVMNLVLKLSNNGVKMIFLRQLELSTFNNACAKLLLAIYAYLDETERKFIASEQRRG